MEYAEFEGIIPEGQYGAGTVLVWDAGPYQNIQTDENGDPVPMNDGIERGHLTVWLEGKKLTGGYALTRTSQANGEEERWLLVKMDDEEADARRSPVSAEPKSVISGRTLEEIETQEQADESEA